MQISKRSLLAIGILAVLLVAIVGVVFVYRSQWWFSNTSSPYSIVYMTNGDIYVGHLSYFPRMTLRDAYQVTKQATTDQGKSPNFTLVPFRDALWSPDRLYINQQQVLLTAPVAPDSRIMQALKK